MSSSSSDEELGKLREALDPSFITKFDGPVKDQTEKKPPRDEDTSITSSQRFFAKHLKSKLDAMIREVTTDQPLPKKPGPPRGGIKLLSGSSVLITEISEPEHVPLKRPRDTKALKESEILSRASEAVVSPEWVLSTDNTKAWKDHKKPRVIEMKSLGNCGESSKLCEVISSCD